MSYAKTLSNCEIKMQKAVEIFKEEIKKFHTGRATPVLVENILVDYYGSKSPIKQIASISIPEPRMILIAPWNKNDISAIEKALIESDLKANPQNDGESIRITLPALTEERRKELVKLLGKEKEKTRVSVKQAREEAWEEIKELETEKMISEDEKFKAKDDLQKVVDGYNKQLDEISERKEEEIMRV